MGRPKGSKNKKTLEKLAAAKLAQETSNTASAVNHPGFHPTETASTKTATYSKEEQVN